MEENMNADQYIQKLLELSYKKLEGLKEILKLTEHQSEIITEDNVEELHEIINLKQQQMDMIDEVDQAFEVYYQRLKSILGVQSLEEVRITQLAGAAELKQIVATIYQTTKHIQNLESINSNKVRDVLNKLSNDIRQVKQGKMVNSGYNIAEKLPQQSYFFDKKK